MTGKFNSIATCKRKDSQAGSMMFEMSTCGNSTIAITVNFIIADLVIITGANHIILIQATFIIINASFSNLRILFAQVRLAYYSEHTDKQH